MLKKKIFSVAFVVLAVGALLGSGFYMGLRVGRSTPEIVEVKNIANTENQASSVDFRTFWDAWKAIDSNYLKADQVDSQTRVYGAIRGLVNSLGDPYTQFFTPNEGKKFQEDVEGNFSGIGAEIGIRKSQLTVIAPLKDSPANKAGIKSGDWILKINSTSTDNLAVDEAVNFIRGPLGTKVILNIFREGWKGPKDFVIVRAPIEVPTLDFEMKGQVAHISLHNFNANASKEFYAALKQASNKNANGIILDLRDDPGGFLEVAVDLAGWFLKPGTVVVKENDRDGTVQTFKAQGNGALENMPLVILINKGSASASEILAGALRDQKGAKLVGETSFGKGTVQQMTELRDGSQIKITIAHWVLPNGQILENGGLKPDYEVLLTDDDIAKNKDPQLDKAIEAVNSLLK